jgi:hypothetical protein
MSRTAPARHSPVPAGPERRLVGYAEVRGAHDALDDAGRQASAGARHLTFGDPDFLDDAPQALRVAELIHERHPGLTYDVSSTVAQLLRHAGLLERLVASGCVSVTVPVVSLDDDVLTLLQTDHRRADVAAAAELCRRAGLGLDPTLVSFHPWTTRRSLLDTFRLLADLGLGDVAPGRFTTRLDLPAGSPLLGLDDVRACLGPYDPARRAWRWSHADPGIDALHHRFEVFATTARALGMRPREAVECLYALAGGVDLF